MESPVPGAGSPCGRGRARRRKAGLPGVDRRRRWPGDRSVRTATRSSRRSKPSAANADTPPNMRVTTSACCGIWVSGRSPGVKLPPIRRAATGPPMRPVARRNSSDPPTQRQRTRRPHSRAPRRIRGRVARRVLVGSRSAASGVSGPRTPPKRSRRRATSPRRPRPGPPHRPSVRRLRLGPRLPLQVSVPPLDRTGRVSLRLRRHGPVRRLARRRRRESRPAGNRPSAARAR